MSAQTSDALQGEIDRLRLEVQSLQAKHGVAEISVGNYLLARLTQLGVKHMFGLPGDFNLGFLDLVEDDPNIEWVGNCNELNAAYAADGYARVKPNSIGVVMTTFGVGELSATNGIAGAFSEMVPVLHLVGVPTTTQQKKRAILHHTLGDGRYDAYSKAAEQFTVFQAHLLNKNDAASLIDRALIEAITKARPVYMTLPADLVYQEISSERLGTPLSRSSPMNDPQTEEFVLDLIHERVKEAESDVVVLVDACVMRYGVHDEVVELLKETGFPVYATPMGKSAVDENWKRYGGIYVGSITHPDIKEKVENAKLILSIDVTSRQLHSSHTQVQYALFPNIGFKQLLPRLTERLKHFFPAASKLPVVPFIKQLPQQSSPVISHSWFWPRLAYFFKSKDIIVTETGTSNFGILDVPLPPQTVLLSQILWGSIGWSVGSCLGAALAGRDIGMERTILFVGDGSLQLTVQELSPMIRLGLKPIIFVLNNKGYTIERCIHGKHRKYNDIADWKWTQLLDVLGDRKNETRSCTVNTKQELSDLLDDPLFGSASIITIVEVMMDAFDAPRALEVQAEMTSRGNAYAAK